MKTIYHGSSEKNLSEIKDTGIFGGLFFASSENSALSHGDYLYEISLNDSDIASDSDLENASTECFRSLFKWLSDEEFSKHHNLLIDLIINGISVNSMRNKESALEALKEEEVADADWFAQNLRGRLAGLLGFKAVEMYDEHGLSYLVLPFQQIKLAD